MQIVNLHSPCVQIIFLSLMWRMKPYLLWPEVFIFFFSLWERMPGGQVRGFKTYFFRIQNHLTPAPLLLGEGYAYAFTPPHVPTPPTSERRGRKKQTMQSSLILRGEKTKYSPRDGKINLGCKPPPAVAYCCQGAFAIIQIIHLHKSQTKITGNYYRLYLCQNFPC